MSHLFSSHIWIIFLPLIALLLIPSFDDFIRFYSFYQSALVFEVLGVLSFAKTADWFTVNSFTTCLEFCTVSSHWWFELRVCFTRLISRALLLLSSPQIISGLIPFSLLPSHLRNLLNKTHGL